LQIAISRLRKQTMPDGRKTTITRGERVWGGWRRRARRFLDSKTVSRPRCIGNMMDGRYKSTGRYKRKRRARNALQTPRQYIYMVGRLLLLLLLPSFHIFSGSEVRLVVPSLVPPNCYPLTYLDTSVHIPAAYH